MFIINGEINDKTLLRLAKYAYAHEGDIVHVYLNSAGGATKSAFAMAEILRTLSDQHGKTVVCQAVNEIFSAALVIFLSADQRIMTSHARALIHEVTVEEGRHMNAASYQTTAEDLVRETQILYDFIACRCKLTRARVARAVKAAPDNNWILSAEDCAKYGICHQTGFWIPDREDPTGTPDETEVELNENGP